LLNRIPQLTEVNSNFPAISNHDLRPVLQHASGSSPNAVVSNLLISTIRYTMDAHRQFRTPVDAIFN
jgi:hypothetical protein